MISRERLKELRLKTNIAYHQSIIDNGGEDGGDADIHYRKNLQKLSTQDLEDILRAHSSGQQRRYNLTIDAIHKELADRALINNDENIIKTD